jgi:hypothetical protein
MDGPAEPKIKAQWLTISCRDRRQRRSAPRWRGRSGRLGPLPALVFIPNSVVHCRCRALARASPDQRGIRHEHSGSRPCRCEPAQRHAIARPQVRRRQGALRAERAQARSARAKIRRAAGRERCRVCRARDSTARGAGARAPLGRGAPTPSRPWRPRAPCRRCSPSGSLPPPGAWPGPTGSRPTCSRWRACPAAAAASVSP